MSDPTHESLHEAFEAIRTFVLENPGATVLSADRPPYLGWEAWPANLGGDGIYISCPVTAVKEVPDNIKDFFRSAAGRIKIAEWLQNGAPDVGPQNDA